MASHTGSRDHGSSHQSAYQKISADQKQIRILHLQPGRRDDDLRCSLEIVSLDDGHARLSYEALSYTWGASTQGNEVLVGDMHVPITDNLAFALRYLRRLRRVRTLWIDALCIYQRNLIERAQQVLIKGEIYSRAHRVLVWLGRGPSHPGVEPVVEESLSMPYGDNVYAELDFAVRDTVPAWWDRVWIVQEVVLAQDIRVHFGRFHIPWDAFCNDFLKVDLGRRGSASVASPISTSAIREVIVTRLRALRRLRAQYRRNRCFEEVVSYTNKASSSDPRDKVFSILSILHPKYLEEVKPVYESSPEVVFTRMTSAAIQIEASLDILQLVGFPKSPSSPSWALDFTRVNGVNIVEKYGFGGLDCDVKTGTLAQFPSSPEHNVDLGLGLLSTSGVLFDRIAISGNQADDRDGNPAIKTVAGILDLALKSLIDLPAYDAFRTAPLRHDGPRLEEDVQARLDNFRANYDNGKHGLIETLQEAYGLWHSILALPKWIPAHRARIGIDIMRFLQYASTAVLGRGAVCFSTSTGFLGLAPDNVMPGDVIALLQGSKFPVALRPLEDDCFEFRGLVFVNGIMFGELLEMCEDTEFEHRKFTLC